MKLPFLHTRRRKTIGATTFFPNRLLATQILALMLFGVILLKLFYLQVVKGEEYRERALSQREGIETTAAKRGNIYAKDKGGDLRLLATDGTFYDIAVDPKLLPDKQQAAKILASLLYTRKDHQLCLEDYRFCPEGSITIVNTTESEEGEEDIVQRNIQFPNFETAKQYWEEEIFRDINVTYKTRVVFENEAEDELMTSVEARRLPGVFIEREEQNIVANPIKVPQEEGERWRIANALAELGIFEGDGEAIFRALEKKELRHVDIKKKVDPSITEELFQIREASKEVSRRGSTPDLFGGVKITAVAHRYYPEGSLAAQILGYLNKDGTAQYGVEQKLDTLLKGTSEEKYVQRDASGNVVNFHSIKKGVPGADLVLTIDTMTQREVERILATAVEEYNADSGQVLVMDPSNGKIIAMANYPTFDPNAYGDVYDHRRTTPEDLENIYKTTPLFTRDDFNRYQDSDFETYTNEWKLHFDPEFYVYKNRVGPEAYKNKIVQDVYEPGSVFKPLTVAIGINAGEITANTKYQEEGPLVIGSYEIRNATDEYLGVQTVTQGVARSSNVVLAQVALDLGVHLVYSYITDRFRFGGYTNIQLANEAPGRVNPKNKWGDIGLATSSYGQGLTATPLQVAQAWASIANGGHLIRPYIVEEVHYPDGTIEKKEPEVLGTVLSPDASSIMNDMLVYSVEQGVAWPAQIKGYRVAGKTGTSEISGENGEYDEDENITSFMGYAPAEDPAFLVLVKFDRPRYGGANDRAWGSTTAAPVFKETMTFLLEHYQIPPSR